MPTRMELAKLELVDSDGPGTQRVAVLFQPGKIGLARARIPSPATGQLCVRVHWVGVCGSDVETFLGRREPEFVAMPTRLGHEVSAVVHAVGEGVDGLAVGDRVAVRYVWGAFAEYVLCTPFNAVKLPESLPLIEGAVVEVVPGILHAADRAAIGRDTRVLITGQGVSGLIMTQVIARRKPAVLAVTDLFDRKLGLARNHGATHAYRVATTSTPTRQALGDAFPDGFDVVIPCVLSGDGVADAVDMAAQNGRVIMYGGLSPASRPVDYFRVHRRRLDIYSTEPKTDAAMRRYFETASALVSAGDIRVADMITHRIGLGEIDRAFELKREPSADVIHVMIDCRG